MSAIRGTTIYPFQQLTSGYVASRYVYHLLLLWHIVQNNWQTCYLYSCLKTVGEIDYTEEKKLLTSTGFQYYKHICELRLTEVTHFLGEMSITNKQIHKLHSSQLFNLLYILKNTPFSLFWYCKIMVVKSRLTNVSIRPWLIYCAN